MFSSRMLAAFAVLAVTVVTALPTTEPSGPRPITNLTDEDFEDSGPWFSFPLFGNLFAPLWKLFPSFVDIGPRISADDTKFEVVVNVKDYKKEDLKVKVKGDFIFIQGSHEAKQDGHDIFASQFFHTYTLPANCSAADVKALLSSDAHLIVTAPVTGQVSKNKEADREVPIEETGKPFVKEDNDKPLTTTPAAHSHSPVETTTILTTVADEKRPTPTTVADKEEVTEKDNVIPHGNEPIL